MNELPRPILLTAFEAFGGDKLNPTALILDRFPEEIGGFSVRKVLLPVEFVRAQEIAFSAYDACAPAAVIMLGQAGGRKAISLEGTGRNLMNARIPDNAGYEPKGIPVAGDGPETLQATLPIEEILEAVRSQEIACERSDDAGGYVCNALLYGMLHHNNGAVPTGFIHVPYIPEQGHPDKPSMALSEIYRGIRTAVLTVAKKTK
ncbi:MAG: pyroglutamyl-peptidase I [Lachnospiraceae bacterium]|nr:pyroglutamyl-peptidase I [Lachnospiraceae bacterium]